MKETSLSKRIAVEIRYKIVELMKDEKLFGILAETLL
jgi:hypothetical protein